MQLAPLLTPMAGCPCGQQRGLSARRGGRKGLRWAGGAWRVTAPVTVTRRRTGPPPWCPSVAWRLALPPIGGQVGPGALRVPLKRRKRRFSQQEARPGLARMPDAEGGASQPCRGVGNQQCLDVTTDCIVNWASRDPGEPGSKTRHTNPDGDGDGLGTYWAQPAVAGRSQL